MDGANPGRKASFVFAANVAGAALGYVALLLIGRYVDPAAFGAYLFALGVTGLFAVLSNLGLGQAHQRHVAQGVPAGQALGVLLRLRFVVAAGLLALLLAGFALLSWLHGTQLTDATTPAVLAMALVLHVLAGSRQVLLDTWLGQQRVGRVEAVKLADTAFTILLLGNLALMLAHLQGRWEVVPGIGAAWARTLGLDRPPEAGEAALLVALCYIVAKAVTLALAWVWSLRDHDRIGGWDRDLARSYLRLAGPLALSGALVLVLQYTDTILLGFFWTAREVGLYGSAQKLTTLCLLGASAAVTVLFPRFSQLHAAGDDGAVDRLFAKAERYLFLLTMPIVMAMVALPREGLHVGVGDAYLDAGRALQFLALWSLVTVLSMPVGARLMGEGRTRLLVKSSALNAGLNVVLNLVLIPRWGLGLGAAGAALATLASTTVFYLYLRWVTRTERGIAASDLHLLRIAVAGLVAAVFWAMARRVAGPSAFDRVWELAGWGLAGLAVYVGALAVLRELSRADRVFLRGVLHPRELLAELRS